ncbi:MAG: PAS domain-containing protein [[Clostridium] scindens]
MIDANDGLFEFIGYTRRVCSMGNHMASVIYPEDLEIMADKLKDQLKHGNTIHNENRLVARTGGCDGSPSRPRLFDEPDGEQYFYCVFVDITEEASA